MSERRETDFIAKSGGVMTDEVGAITGEVTLVTEVDDGGTVRQRVQYKDADEWYGVTDSAKTLPPGGTIDTVHEAAVTRLSKNPAS